MSHPIPKESILCSPQYHNRKNKLPLAMYFELNLRPEYPATLQNLQDFTILLGKNGPLIKPYTSNIFVSLALEPTKLLAYPLGIYINLNALQKQSYQMNSGYHNLRMKVIEEANFSLFNKQVDQITKQTDEESQLSVSIVWKQKVVEKIKLPREVVRSGMEIQFEVPHIFNLLLNDGSSSWFQYNPNTLFEDASYQWMSLCRVVEVYG
ncbi:hypothetical protein FGO68_gene15431 [Halteria grandinella]|uniref:Uncharacterized protein n=1 Tax=Halteria grandinella TaxID=5974 RepID=A0A8J8NQW7_HALGN|nr:hypothetical protein FGO68_gene15431 [Halteria grandinella]